MRAEGGCVGPGRSAGPEFRQRPGSRRIETGHCLEAAERSGCRRRSGEMAGEPHRLVCGANFTGDARCRGRMGPAVGDTIRAAGRRFDGCHRTRLWFDARDAERPGCRRPRRRDPESVELSRRKAARFILRRIAPIRCLSWASQKSPGRKPISPDEFGSPGAWRSWRSCAVSKSPTDI